MGAQGALAPFLKFGVEQSGALADLRGTDAGAAEFLDDGGDSCGPPPTSFLRATHLHPSGVRLRSARFAHLPSASPRRGEAEGRKTNYRQSLTPTYSCVWKPGGITKSTNRRAQEIITPPYETLTWTPLVAATCCFPSSEKCHPARIASRHRITARDRDKFTSPVLQGESSSRECAREPAVRE